MGQVIEVRFVNPATRDVLADEFTVTSTKNFSKTSHTAMHQEAIELALHAWSDGAGVLKGIQREEEAEWIQAGANSCWRYVYTCMLADEEFDREVVAVLFAEYKEKEKSE